MIDRRQMFLGALAGLGLSTVAGTASAMTQPFARIGVQLYTVRDAFKADPAGTLQKVRAIGYDEVETINFANMAPADFKAMVTGAGLSAPSSHMGLADLRTRAEAAFDDIAAIGAEFAVLAWLPEEERKDWEALGAEMNGWGELARARGLTFAYHNHNFEFAPLADGSIPYHLLMDNTDPAKVAFELDCYWCSFAGHDPMEILGAHGDRIRQLHLKDKTASGDMAPVGQGVIDFPTVLAKAKDVGVKHVYVEHDNPTDPFASITASLKYLKG